MKNHFAAFRNLCDGLEAHVEQSNRKFYKRERIDYLSYQNNPTFDIHTEEVPAIAIHIPEHRVDDFLSLLDDRKFKEMEIRDNVPAVKKAYEHYQLLLKMCGVDYDARY